MTCHKLLDGNGKHVGFTCDSGPVHQIEVNGRVFRFVDHFYFGPAVVRNDGEHKLRQPGVNSPFWPAYSEWRREKAKAQP